jgi:hypothetical protein
MPTVNNRGRLFWARPSAASPGGAMAGANAPAVFFGTWAPLALNTVA